MFAGCQIPSLGRRAEFAAPTLARPLAATKSEYRISKSETNPKSKCSKPRCEVTGSLDGTVSDFGHSHFEFVSSFVLRISDFEKFAHRARILTVCSTKEAQVSDDQTDEGPAELGIVGDLTEKRCGPSRKIDQHTAGRRVYSLFRLARR